MANEKIAPIPGSKYHLHPGFAMEAAFVRNLPEKTGKSLEEWIEVIKATGPKTMKEQVQWLKAGHGVTTNYARTLAQRAQGSGGAADYHPEAIVDALFSGKKAHLRLIFEKLLQLGFELGEDVKACPCKTFVPLYRNHVFAQIKPTTNTRVDFGLALKDTPVTGRLIDTGGFAKKDRITHRIAISSFDEIDTEVEKWLLTAYEMDG